MLTVKPTYVPGSQWLPRFSATRRLAGVNLFDNILILLTLLTNQPSKSLGDRMWHAFCVCHGGRSLRISLLGQGPCRHGLLSWIDVDQIS